MTTGDAPDPTAESAFGRAVASRRAELGLSRKDVAARSGLSYPYLADIESGRKHPSAKALNALADALQTRGADLLDRADSLSTLTAETPGQQLFALSPPAPAPGDRSWFRGDRVAPPRSRALEGRDDIREIVRQVLREELWGYNPEASAPHQPFQAGDTPAPPRPPESTAATPTPARSSAAQAGPALPTTITEQLPAWLTEPARSGTDMAIQAVVLEHLHHLDPTADRAAVGAAIRAALDDLIDRARQRRRR